MNASPRKRAGRPAVILGGSSVVAVHIPLRHKTILMAEAAQKHWSVAEVLRTAIAQYVDSKQVTA